MDPDNPPIGTGSKMVHFARGVAPELICRMPLRSTALQQRGWPVVRCEGRGRPRGIATPICKRCRLNVPSRSRNRIWEIGKSEIFTPAPSHLEHPWTPDGRRDASSPAPRRVLLNAAHPLLQ